MACNVAGCPMTCSLFTHIVYYCSSTRHAMSPSTPTKDLKLNVPRHNTQRIGPMLTGAVQAVAREQKIKTDLRQSGHDPGSALAIAVVGYSSGFGGQQTHSDGL